MAEPRNGKSPPPPVRIRWYHTRALNKDGGSDRLNSWTPVVALGRARGGRQTIVNELPQGEPGRDAVEAAVRQVLSGLNGRWAARIAPVAACCIEIAAPDGFRWLAFVPNPGRQERRTMARRLTDACHRPTAPAAATRWRRAWILITEER